MYGVSSEKTKMTITACEVNDDGTMTIDTSNSFELMINPNSVKHGHTIVYDKKKTQGQAGSEIKFSAIEPETLSFDVVMDGTGVVESTSSDDVRTRVDNLKDIAYTYNGTKHEPNHLEVLWGSFLYYGRLGSMTVDYTLFKPSGEPLRAKLNLSFSGFMSTQEEALSCNRSSPDMTHLVEVKDGDTLPLLCYRIYKSCAYYPQVAKANNLRSFRDLKPGSKLYFPPLR